MILQQSGNHTLIPVQATTSALFMFWVKVFLLLLLVIQSVPKKPQQCLC